MINNNIIKNYVEDDMTIEEYADCDSFPSDDFIEAFEEA